MTLRLERYRPGMSEGDKALLDQRQCEAIERAFNSLQDAFDAIVAANGAAAAATSAAATANTAAANITTADSLSKSYVSGCTITATDAGSDATITISAHTRNYPQPDGSVVSVAVSGATLTARAYSTKYYITYSDPSRAGGAVTYSTTTTEPAQIGNLHVVGSVLTPAAAGSPTPGGTVRPPGTGTINA